MSQEEKQVSVVIPLYNRQEKIVRALDSIRTQTALNRICEIIVVDDGSTDQSVQAVSNYHLKYPFLPIKLICQENRGPSSARNRGMSAATGYYIAFLDSDDEWITDKLEIQLTLMDANEDIDFLGGGEDDKPLRILFKTTPKLYKATLTDLLLKSFPVTPSIIFKQKIYTTIGGFDEQISYYEDCDYLQQICAFGYGYYYLAEKMVICDRDKPKFGAVGLSSNLKKIYEDCITSLKKRLKDKKISLRFYVFLRMFYFAKHIRRLIITRIRILRGRYENCTYRIGGVL